MGIRVSARRRRKTHRRARNPRLAIVKLLAAARASQNLAFTDDGASFDRTNTVVVRPTRSTATAEEDKRSHATGRGGRGVTAVSVSVPAVNMEKAEAADPLRPEHTSQLKNRLPRTTGRQPSYRLPGARSFRRLAAGALNVLPGR